MGQWNSRAVVEEWNSRANLTSKFGSGILGQDAEWSAIVDMLTCKGSCKGKQVSMSKRYSGHAYLQGFACGTNHDTSWVHGLSFSVSRTMLCHEP